MKYNLIIKNGYIYNTNTNKIILKDIAIKDGIIKKIDKIITDKADKIIDAKNHVIMPGFINSHIHFGEYYLKGYDNNYGTKKYIEYAENFNELNKKYKEEIRTSSSIITAYEAIKYGQTTLMGIRGWDCLEKYKIRLYMGYPFMLSNKLGDYSINAFEKYEKLKITNLNNYYIFIHSLLTVDEKILKEISNYIKNNKVFLAIHLSETKEEEKLIKKKYGMSSIEVLKTNNLLSSRTMLVHCCYISEEDIRIIKKYNCSISINPNSNLKLNNKIPNIKKLDGINICIGTDGVATNDSLNIIDSLKAIGLLYRIKDSELIKMITLNPGKYLKNKTGKIEVNYKADLNIYDLNDYRIVCKDTFINNLIYSSDIEPQYVITEGGIIIDNYQNTKITDEELERSNISNYLNFNRK